MYALAMESRFVTWKDLKSRVPMSLEQVYRLEKQGLFPQRRRIGARKTAWLENEVEAWFRTRQVVGMEQRYG